MPDEEWPFGYGSCHCGCGEATWVATYNSAARGWTKGEPVRYRRGHDKWKTGRVRGKHGRWLVAAPGHPRAKSRGSYVPEHVLVAEDALGRHLPEGAVVHHVNSNPSDNRAANLVVCQDQSYHMLIHTRVDALSECGNPGWRRCHLCGEYDAPENLYIGKGRRNRTVRHRRCHAERERQRRTA